MAHIVIEMDRGEGWEVRQQGAADVTVDQLAAMLPRYTIQYPHRVFVDGNLIASSVRKRNGRVIVTRHN